jgi:superfamily I DNA/RNA helicase
MGEAGAVRPPGGPTREQQGFVDRALESHACLVAGPGTGKTRSLAFVADALLARAGVMMEGLVVLTLTRALAVSLAQRIPNGKASTLHSFALWHLNRLGEAWGRRVADSWSQENLIQDDLQLGVEATFGERPTMPQVKKFLKALGAAFRDGQEEPAKLDVVQQRLWQVFRGQRELFQYRLMDELVTDLLNLLDQGTQLEPLPTHVLVDEYQDLTAGELRLLQLLAERGAKIIAAGDDRQSIYSFREADERALHRFGEVYGVKLDPLTESWRCPRRVCELAEAVARPLPPLPGFTRPPLTPKQHRTDKGEVRLIVTPSPKAEARWITRECRRLTEQGVKAHEIMIVAAGFFDAVFVALKDAADEVEGLPFSFYDPRGVDPAASADAVRLLGAGARLLADDQDHIAWRTLVWATPQLGPERLTTLLMANQGDYRRNLEFVGARDKVCARPLTAGRVLSERLGGQAEVSARDIVTLLAEHLGIEGLDMTSLTRLEAEVGATASPAEWARVVVELSQSTMVSPKERPDDIPVRTIFGAKGLEAPIVFVAGAIEPCFTGRVGAADGVRRLYVAVTRAEKSLYVSAPRTLRNSYLGNMARTRIGGLAGLITIAAGRVGLRVEIMP